MTNGSLCVSATTLRARNSKNELLRKRERTFAASPLAAKGVCAQRTYEFFLLVSLLVHT